VLEDVNTSYRAVDFSFFIVSITDLKSSCLIIHLLLFLSMSHTLCYIFYVDTHPNKRCCSLLRDH